MKQKIRILAYLAIVLGLLLVLTFSCKKDKPILASVKTAAVSGVSSTTATSGGEVTTDGGATVTARGVCWSTSQTPTTADSKTTDGSGLGSFSSSITGLTSNTAYYVRAYAINSGGTAYGSDVSFTTKETVADVDGNVYAIVTIGTQTWMGENLKTTKYNDGIDIIYPGSDFFTWANNTDGAYAWYNNDPAQKNTYGALYNWYAVNTGKICPAGWHVPSSDEWTTLLTYLGDNAGGKLKEAGTVHWLSPNEGATNESGFSALPGGDHTYTGGWEFIGEDGAWWSSTEYAYNLAISSGMHFFNNSIDLGGDMYKGYGFSVRCIKDN